MSAVCTWILVHQEDAVGENPLSSKLLVIAFSPDLGLFSLSLPRHLPLNSLCPAEQYSFGHFFQHCYKTNGKYDLNSLLVPFTIKGTYNLIKDQKMVGETQGDFSAK